MNSNKRFRVPASQSLSSKESSEEDGASQSLSLEESSEEDGTCVTSDFRLNLNKKIDPEVFKDMSALAVIRHLYPLSFFEHGPVGELITYNNDDVEPLSGKALKNHCLKIHRRERDGVKKMLEKVLGRISLTCHIRTCALSYEYLCLSAHYVDDEWNLCSLILSFLHVPPPLTDEVLYENVYKLLKEWGIEKKLFSITFDSTCNDNMQERLRNYLNLEKPLLSNGSYFRIGCCACLLDLIVQEGLKVIDVTVKMIREGIRYVTASEARRLSFQKCAKRVGCDLSKGLWLDFPAKWNSTHAMLERAMVYKDAFTAFDEWNVDIELDVVLDDEIFKWSLNEEDWDRISRICGLLKPLSQFSTLFTGTKYPTSNLYFRYFWLIKLRLMQEMQCEDIHVRDMATRLKVEVEKYWDSYSVVFAFAIILDPRYKLDYIKWSYKMLDESTYLAKTNHIVNQLYRLYNEYANENASTGGASNATTMDVEDNDYLKDFDLVMGKLDSSQLDRYLGECRFPRTQELDTLDYWKLNEQRFPVLSRMARDILSIPITTVASESTFSMGSRVMTKMSGSLLPEYAEALVTTRSWLFGFKKEGATGGEEEQLVLEYQLSGESPSDLSPEYVGACVTARSWLLGFGKEGASDEDEELAGMEFQFPESPRCEPERTKSSVGES